MPKRERMLTLVEVLLLAGIVLVFAGLVGSTLDERSEKRRVNTCISNLRQLHAAFNMYSADHNGAFPGNSSQTRRYYGWESPWPADIGRYLKDRKAVRCPDDSSDNPPNLDAYRTWGHVTSYMMNQAIGWKHPKWQDVASATKYSDIASPRHTLLLVDREGWHFRQSRTDTYRNALFLDGHIEPHSDDEIRSSYWGQIPPKPAGAPSRLDSKGS